MSIHSNGSLRVEVRTDKTKEKGKEHHDRTIRFRKEGGMCQASPHPFVTEDKVRKGLFRKVIESQGVVPVVCSSVGV